MIGSLSRLGREVGAYSGSAEIVGSAATNVAPRKIGMGYIDGKAFPNEKSEEQLESFRGVVYAAVDKIAKRFAQLNVNLFTCEHDAKKDEIIETRTNFHPFMTLFSTANGHRPHEEFSTWELMYTWDASIDTTGETWWLTERDSLGRPARVTPLPTNRMTIVFSKETGLTAGYMFVPKGCTFTQGGIFFPKFDWKYLQANPTTPFITYWRYPSPRGIEDPRGWSPVKAAAYAYDINLFEQIYKRNFLQQGAQLGGILQSEVALNRNQIEEYLDQFKLRHSGINKAGLPMVLPKMLKWTTTEPTPRDMQWAEAINLTASQILQIYGISDAKLGRADVGNRNTSDAVDATFNREVVQSRCDVFNSNLNSGFLPIYPGQSDKLYLSARMDDPVPADTEAQMKKEKQDLELNVTTPNEIREKRKVKPFGKFGNQVFVPLAKVAVDPWDEGKLELSQDDADKLGFISAEEQQALDQATAEAAAAAKPDPAAKPAPKPKDGGKGGADGK